MIDPAADRPTAADSEAGADASASTDRTPGIDAPTGTDALVAAAATGSERAWDELVRRYTPLVLSVIRSYGMSRADAADVNQTVWLRLVEHLSRLREPNALAGWLATTARRECYRLLRAGRRTQPFDPYDDSLGGHLDASLLVETASPDEQLLRAERYQALREGFAQLSPRCQQLLSLLVGEPPATYRQIGERMGMPIGSIGPTQARCLQKLRDCPALATYVERRPGLDGGGDRDGVVAAGR